MFKKILDWIQARLKEKSTLLGITALGAVVGVNVTPELQDTIIQGAGAVGSLIAIVSKDKPVKK